MGAPMSLTKSDMIAIVIGVVNTLVSIFAIVQAWQCYRRRIVYKRRKAAKNENHLASEAKEVRVEGTLIPVLSDNRKADRCGCKEASGIQDLPPPYPLPQMPPVAKISLKSEVDLRMSGPKPVITNFHERSPSWINGQTTLYH